MQFKLICCQKSRSYYSIIKSVIYAAPSFHNSKLSILSIKLDSYPLLSIASSVEPKLLHHFAIIHRATVTPNTVNDGVDTLAMVITYSFTNRLFVGIISDLIAT